MFKGRDFLSINDFTKDELEYILQVADKMLPYAKREKRTTVLDGAVLANLFFEPSTRTRISFGVAFNLLGGFVENTVGVKFSSIVKGESIFDTARVISGYSDIISIRHPHTGQVAQFAKGSTVPVVNGGDGVGEHPTQAMLDLYTIYKEKKRIDNINISLVGDLKFGRTVHSLSMLLSMYKNINFTFISPKELSMPEYIKEKILQSGNKIKETENLIEGISQADIIYSTRIQEERFVDINEYNRYKGVYSINQALLNQYCKKDVLLMHPLPRDSRIENCELDEDLNNIDNLAIFRQSNNGIPVRMAIFALLLGVEDKVQKYEKEVTWHTNK